MQVKQKDCRNPDCSNKFTPRLSTDKFCSYGCAKACQKPTDKKPVPIKKVSEKRKLEDIVYKSERIKFLMLDANKICFIDECNQPSTTIEHIAGRKGYADDWARDNNISLYIDKRYWRGCCLHHNLALENDPELSKKYQISKIHLGKK